MDHQVIDCGRNNIEYRGFRMMRSLSSPGSHGSGSEEEMGIRKGAWTEEEDVILANYVTLHGEGHWNSLARSAGLKRTGKSCRLRWLNYLRPDVRRGNITLQEQLLILHLHSRWGNRWSKIAQELPGRTDNEIKNYWRTRVVKQAKQLKCDVNSKQFRDALRFVWMPRLQERIQASSSQTTSSSHSSLLHRCHSASTLPSQSDCHLTTKPRTGIHAEQESSCWNNVEYSQEIQAIEFEAANADLWTHENIRFLQQQLADDF